MSADTQSTASAAIAAPDWTAVVDQMAELLDAIRAHRFTVMGFTEHARHFSIDKNCAAAANFATDRLIDQADLVLEAARTAHVAMNAQEAAVGFAA